MSNEAKYRLEIWGRCAVVGLLVVATYLINF